MSILQRAISATTLWVYTAVIAIALILDPFVDGVRPVLYFLQLGFVLLHGAQRYSWRAVGIFVLAVLVISNIMENLSIETGFPFGDYHYTGGGKIFNVPWVVGGGYLRVSYLALIVAAVLVSEVRRNSPWLVTIGAPVVGAFATTSYDLSGDPTDSTISGTWIWESGGGFFGVPLINFLGWTLTTYLFLQLFALYMRRRGPLLTADPHRATASDLQGVLLFGMMAISYFLATIAADRPEIVTDASGTPWYTGDIFETATLVTIYSMFFMAVLALLRIGMRRITAPADAKPLRLQEGNQRADKRAADHIAR
jgi:putative membrane protein